MIPKRTTLLGHSIKVSRVKKVPQGKGARGMWVPYKNKIYVEYNQGNPDLEEQTYWHEMAHAMMDNMGRQDLNADEQFIDMLGSMLHQVIKTAEY